VSPLIREATGISWKKRKALKFLKRIMVRKRKEGATGHGEAVDED